MNNKSETSFIQIIKSGIKGRGVKKDQLLILLLLGVLLLVIAVPTEEERPEQPTGEEPVLSQEETKLPPWGTDSYEETLAGKLEQFLSQVEGVGRVRVLIKAEGSGERIVEKDLPLRESAESQREETGSTSSGRETERQETTVYEETEDGRQIPYVVRQTAPRIEGVVVAAEGGGEPVVEQNILEAVQALLQIEVHKIKVLKLEGMEEMR